MTIRAWTEPDLPALHALNEAAVPAVNSMPPADLRDLLARALVADVAEVDGSVAGFVVCLGEGLSYGSDNYRWFSARYAAFAYIDRAVVDAGQRDGGLGTALYDSVETRLTGRRPVLTCEVNEEPPNPASMRFHMRRGFEPVGRQRTEGGRKSVVLLAKDLPAG